MTPSRTRILSLCVSAFGVFLILFSTDSAFAAATISLKAVAKNGVPIAPTSTLQIQPGDVITADIFLSGWNNPPFDGAQGLVHLYQVALAGWVSAMSSGGCGLCNTEYVLPWGWDAPLGRDVCPCGDPCFPVCNASSKCVGDSFNPSQMVQVDTTRTDWIFHGFSDLTSVDDSTVNVRWGSVIFDEGGGGQSASRCSGGSLDGFSCSSPANCNGGFCDPNYSSYGGTLNLKAGTAACGTYTISFEGNETFIANDAPAPEGARVYPATESLTLTTGLPCDACFACLPANCSIDARRPFPPNLPAYREGFTSWTWSFQHPISDDETAPDDFTVRQVPPETPPLAPIIASVMAGAGNSVVLNFDLPIQPNHWTCVTHNASGIEKCLGYLPGDADGNRTVSAVDIMKIIDNLNGAVHPPLPLHQCDIDRSGVCAPADILTEIDLLNGVTGFQRQNGKILEPCPSAP